MFYVPNFLVLYFIFYFVKTNFIFLIPHFQILLRTHKHRYYICHSISYYRLYICYYISYYRLYNFVLITDFVTHT